MSIEIKAPTFPESVQEGSIATWHKQPGETVSRDDLLVDIETDKVVLEVVAPVDGILAKTLKEEGAIVLSNEVIALINEGEASEPAASVVGVKEEPIENNGQEKTASPSARKLASEQDVDLRAVTGSGKDGRITKEDVAHVGGSGIPEVQVDSRTTASSSISIPAGDRIEKRVPMTRMRARIADRLLQVTQTTAMLTTFNEVDMHKIMDLRSEFKDEFSKIHPGARLGFMGFFVRVATEALKRFPSVNASIDGSDVIYHGYQDIGVAVSTEKGLVVPVLRNAENMSIADVERTIAELGAKSPRRKINYGRNDGRNFHNN